MILRRLWSFSVHHLVRLTFPVIQLNFLRLAALPFRQSARYKLLNQASLFAFLRPPPRRLPLSLAFIVSKSVNRKYTARLCLLSFHIGRAARAAAPPHPPDAGRRWRHPLSSSRDVTAWGPRRQADEVSSSLRCVIASTRLWWYVLILYSFRTLFTGVR